MAEIFVGRQPIYDRDLEVYAYELMSHSGHTGEQQDDPQDADRSTSQVILNAFLEIGIDRLVGKNIAFIKLAERFLNTEDELPLPSDRVILKIPSYIRVTDQVVAGAKRLTGMGFRLALDNYLVHKQLQPLASMATMIDINIESLPGPELQACIKVLKKLHPILLADHVRTHDEYVLCRDLGMDYFQGYFLSRPKLVSGESLTIEVVQLDVTDGASIKAAVANVLASAGTIDVLVNNAGFGYMGPIEEADIDEAKLVFETNFFGPLRLIQAVLPTMREQGAGTIVNVSSLSGVIAEPYNGIYASSKHALEALSEVLHYELHPFGIRVAIIEPGGHDTKGYWNARKERRLKRDSPHFEYGDKFMEAVKRIPGAEKPGDPRTVAEAIYEAVYTNQPRLRYPVHRRIGCRGQ